MNTQAEAGSTASFWKGFALGVGVFLLLLGVATAVMHYGMARCPFCGSDMTEASEAPAVISGRADAFESVAYLRVEPTSGSAAVSGSSNRNPRRWTRSLSRYVSPAAEFYR